MSPQEEQGFLEDRFADENCDDCGQGADGHTVWTNDRGKPVVDCNDD